MESCFFWPAPVSVSVLRSGLSGSCCCCSCLLTNCLVVPVRCLGFYLVLLCGPVAVAVVCLRCICSGSVRCTCICCCLVSYGCPCRILSCYLVWHPVPVSASLYLVLPSVHGLWSCSAVYSIISWLYPTWSCSCLLFICSCSLFSVPVHSPVSTILRSIVDCLVLSSVLVPVTWPVPVLVAVHPVLSSCSLCVVPCSPVYSIYILNTMGVR